MLRVILGRLLSAEARFRLKRIQLSMRPRPMMSPHDRRVLEGVLRSGGHRRVVEFGAGGSTLYFPPRLPELEHWLALESDPQWAAFLAPRCPAGVQLEVIHSLQPAFEEHAAALRAADLVLIDGGLDRAACIEGVRGAAPNAVVLLHDALRPTYASAKARYRREIVLTHGHAHTPEGVCLAGGFSLLVP